MPPSLPLLGYVPEPHQADWLRLSMTTFGERVASFLPDHFESYARIFHPFGHGSGTEVPAPTWQELPAVRGSRYRCHGHLVSRGPTGSLQRTGPRS
jgi:hypothetical protein